MKMRNLGIKVKYFIAGLLAIALGGRVHAQNEATTEMLDEIDNVIPPDKTLTHSLPFVLKSHSFSQNSKVKIPNVDDAIFAEFIGAANMGLDKTTFKFSPYIQLKPFIRFNDRTTIGFQTTATVQNYVGDTISGIVRDMYIYTKVHTNIGDFKISVGKFAPMDYLSDFSGYIPAGCIAINWYDMNNPNIFPRAAFADFDNGKTRFGIGYVESHDGFRVAGDGRMVICMEQSLDKDSKFGGFIVISQQDTYGNIYISNQITQNVGYLIQAVNIGNRAAFHLLYKQDLGSRISLSVNGYYQTKDGASGANISIHHRPSGAYISTGASRPDCQNNPDAGAKKLKPFVEMGIVKTVYPKRTR